MLKEVTRVKSKQIRETRWGSGKRRRKGESEWRIGPEGIRWRWERMVFASCWTKWWSWEERLLMDSLVIWLKSSRNTHNSFLPRRIRLGLLVKWIFSGCSWNTSWIGCEKNWGIYSIESAKCVVLVLLETAHSPLHRACQEQKWSVRVPRGEETMRLVLLGM